MGSNQGINWNSFGINFAIGATNADKSDMHSASAFTGYAGLPLAKNEALLARLAKTSTSWADKAVALKAAKGFAIVGKSIGALGAGLSVLEDKTNGNLGWGTAAKVGIGMLTTFGGPLGLAYGIIDIGWGMYSGTTITDSIAAGVDNAMRLK